jgi:acetyl esterase/lipase
MRVLRAVSALAGLQFLLGCSPLGIINAIVPSGTYVATQDVRYSTGPRHQLDVYQPNLPVPSSGYPVVIFFYGGSWNSGERADYKFVGEALASRGILTLIADYRLYPEVRYPEFLNDCALAVAYGLKQVPILKGDAKRVFVMGHSAGAYNASMMAFDERWLKSVGHSSAELAGFIGLAGPYDFLPMTNPNTRPVFFHPNYPAGSQPIDYVSRSVPRTFLGAAKEDSLVNPTKNSVAISERLKAAGADVTLRLYDRVNHVTLAASLAGPLRWLAPVLDDVVSFVNAK